MSKTTTRKSFIIHKDSLDILKDLTDEQAGQLFKAINHYQNGNDFELSQILKIAFNPFKNQFVRDDEKYLALCEKNRQIAINRHSTSGTKRNQPLPEVPSVTKSTDNDSKSKSDSKNKHTEENKLFEQFWKNYPKKTNKKNSLLSFNKLTKAKQTLATEDCKSRFVDTETRYIPNPSTYLNGERWEDESTTVSTNDNYWGNAI